MFNIFHYLPLWFFHPSDSFGFDFHFPITNDVKHLFMWLLAFCVSYLKLCLSYPLLIFYWVIYFWVARVLYISYMQIPCQLYDLPDIFSYSVGCLFTFLMVSFEAQMFLILMKSKVSIFFFLVISAFDVVCKKVWLSPRSGRFPSLFLHRHAHVYLQELPFVEHLPWAWHYAMHCQEGIDVSNNNNSS